MADYRSMFEGKYLGAWSLIDAEGKPREVTVTIERVEAGEIVGEGGRKTKKPIVHFVGGRWLPMVCGKTVAKTIAAMYTRETNSWSGKRITLYPTTTDVGGETKDCIRVRNTIPPEPPRNGKKREEAADVPS